MTDEERHAIMTAFGAAIRIPGQHGAACRLDAEVMIEALRRNGFALVPFSGEAWEEMVERARKGMFETVPHSAWRRFTELGDATAAEEIVAGILRAALSPYTGGEMP